MIDTAAFAKYSRRVVEKAIAHDRACHAGTPAGLHCTELGDDGAVYNWTSGQPVPPPVKAKWDALAEEWATVFERPEGPSR